MSLPYSYGFWSFSNSNVFFEWFISNRFILHKENASKQKCLFTHSTLSIYSLGENHHVWLANLFLCRCCVHDYRSKDLLWAFEEALTGEAPGTNCCTTTHRPAHIATKRFRWRKKRNKNKQTSDFGTYYYWIGINSKVWPLLLRSICIYWRTFFNCLLFHVWTQIDLRVQFSQKHNCKRFVR
jgi:hypothetical protein